MNDLVQVNFCQKLFHYMKKDCGLVDARISASEKDLPVCTPSIPKNCAGQNIKGSKNDIVRFFEDRTKSKQPFEITPPLKP